MEGKRLNVILDNETLEILDTWCLVHGLTRSAALRLIVKQFLGDGPQLVIK